VRFEDWQAEENQRLRLLIRQLRNALARERARAEMWRLRAMAKRAKR
jgi:hypothetical protein